MPTAELHMPVRLLAGGGPSAPDPRVLRALATPLVGQFDPAFTQIMDDVVQLARATFLTSSPHCFAVSATAQGGLEAVLNSLLEDGDCIEVLGGPGYVEQLSQWRQGTNVRAQLVPLLDPFTLERYPIERRDLPLIVDATFGLGACELRVDEWSIDVCVAGVDYAVGAPPGMALVTYSPAIQTRMEQRSGPPRTSYLDLLQLQAYWSPERLNHHTAPTALVYGLREALRLLHEEGLETRWQRHQEVGQLLRNGLASISGIDSVGGDLPYSIVHLGERVDEPAARQRLLDQFGVHVTPLGPRQWRVALLGADASPAAANVVLAAFDKVLRA